MSDMNKVSQNEETTDEVEGHGHVSQTDEPTTEGDEVEAHGNRSDARTDARSDARSD